MTVPGNRLPHAALFDFDMTVADTAGSILKSMNMFAREKDLPPVTEAALMKAIGLTLEETWMSYWGRCEPGWPDYYRAKYKTVEISGFRPFPDTLEVMAKLRFAGVRTAVVTNRWMARLAVETSGLAGQFDAIVGAEDVARPKPFPDPVLRALRTLDVPPSRAVLVGDSHLDMKAAVAAGVTAIGVSTGGTSAEALSEAGAWEVCASLGEILRLIGM
ncbi:MAG: HAD-IA family hydrolase [Deltaproteobacteria bacterium]|jgi:HAD superfamily hydrolase (TIGR01509 family)|nr:HAD-IA family hydrolase [Deltaproteobacteria bacterium]